MTVCKASLKLRLRMVTFRDLNKITCRDSCENIQRQGGQGKLHYRFMGIVFIHLLIYVRGRQGRFCLLLLVDIYISGC
jgi:hypothetical protein